ncbi:MAG TPA: metalloregulator ArsR/SmtB family transcription factor [Sphingomicrobium sp.]|nr:metalloregulator ArsR/SmtB family transcription factor [Sphingomicrobium sp.]
MANLDTVFHGLADPTRRAVITRLAGGPAAVSELAAPHKMALPSFLKHLKVLEEAGLVKSRKLGRVRTCALEIDAMAQVERWITDRKRFWEQQYDQLEAYLASTALEEKTDDSH